MGRIRTIKPEFFTHEQLFDAERDTRLPLRLAFIGLFTVADREGRFRWRPRELKLDVLPYDDTLDFSIVLDALCATGFVVRYAVDGEHYGYIPTFKKHQVVNPREAQSRLPDPAQGTVITCELQCNYSETHVHARENEKSSKPPPDKDSGEMHGNYSETHVHARGELELELELERELEQNKRHSDSSSSSYASAGKTLDAVAISVALIKWERERKKQARGISASSPHVCDLAALNVSGDELRAAYDDAVADRNATANANPINAGFVRAFVEKHRRPPPQRAPNVHDDRKRAYEVLTGKGGEVAPDSKTIDGGAHVKRIG